MTQRQARDGMPFNLGWWGFTFPLGVYALTTLRLGEALAAPFFTGLGAVLVLLLALLWTLVASRTLAGAYRAVCSSRPASPTCASRCARACSKARELESNKAKMPEEAEFTSGK